MKKTFGLNKLFKHRSIGSNQLPEIPTQGLLVNLDGLQSSSFSGNTFTDLSGNNNNATSVNGAYYSSSDKAIIFDGTNDYATINVDSWIRTQSSTYTFNAYFQYFESGYSGGGAPFCVTPVNHYGDTMHGFWQHLNFRLLGNQYLWRTRDAFNTPSGTVISPSPFVSGNRYMLTVVVSTNLLKFYVNGNLINTINTNFSWANTQADRPMYIILGQGYPPSHGGYPQNCKMYNFQAYDRELTASEVLQTYNSIKIN